MNSGKECTICFNEISTESNYTKTICNHSFCSSCLFEWLQRKPVCPICRKTLAKTPNYDHRNTRMMMSYNMPMLDDYHFMEHMMENNDEFRIHYYRIENCVSICMIMTTLSIITFCGYVIYVLVT